MSTQTDQKTPNAAFDKGLVFVAIAVAVAGLLAFTFLTDETLTIRLAALFGGLLVGALIAAFSLSGKRFFAYGRSSYEELRRVVWPTRRETINTTGMVSAFAVAVAIYLFLIDKLVQWAMYDGLLKLTF